MSSLSMCRITIWSACQVRFSLRRVRNEGAAHALGGKLGACPVFSDISSSQSPACHKTFAQSPFILSLLAPDFNGTSSPSFQAWELLANDRGMLHVGTKCSSLSNASAAMM